MKKSAKTITRLGAFAFVVALALTAVYYYGVARAQPAVALPSAISLSGSAATPKALASTTDSSELLPTTSTAKTTATTSSTGQSVAPHPSTTAVTAPAAQPPRSAPALQSRQVVTPVRGWNCDSGSAPHSAGAGTSNVDCR